MAFRDSFSFVHLWMSMINVTTLASLMELTRVDL